MSMPGVNRLWPNLACCLFLYGPLECFTIFYLVEKNQKKSICDIRKITWNSRWCPYIKCIGTEPNPLPYVLLSMAAFSVQQQSWVVVTEIVQPAEPKILTTFSKSWVALACPVHIPTFALWHWFKCRIPIELKNWERWEIKVRRKMWIPWRSSG